MRKYRAWCSCSWHGEYATEGLAEGARRRHSCELWVKRRGVARRQIQRKANLDRTIRPCTHKIAYHDHGTYARFTLDHCHCDHCRAAKTAYEKERRRRKVYGEVAYVDARPATAHMRELMAAGMGWKRIASLAGLDASVVYPLLYGRPDRNGGAVRTKARAATVAALLSVTVDLADSAVVHSVGASRRLQALCAVGWSVNQIASRSGLDRQALDAALAGRRILARTVRAIAAIYDELWDQTPPQGNQRERISVSRTLRRAAEAGWVVPLAWDDIDDPREVPGGTDTTSATFDLDDWLHLVRGGEDPARAAIRCGAKNLKTVERAAYRIGRSPEYLRARKEAA